MLLLLSGLPFATKPKNEFAALKCILKTNAAKRPLQSQLIIFAISLWNDLDNKKEHGHAYTVFQTPTLCQHLFTATERPDAALLSQAVGKASRAAAQVARSDYGDDKPGIQQNLPWLMTSGFLLTFDPFWFGREQKSPFTRAPHTVYLTKAAITYMLINVFALHAAGGGPRPPRAVVQVRASLPSLYVTQNKSGKPTTRHTKMTKTGKDNFCRWREKLLRPATAPQALSPRTQKPVESFCHERFDAALAPRAISSSSNMLWQRCCGLQQPCRMLSNPQRPLSSPRIVTIAMKLNAGKWQGVCHHSALAWQPSAPVALIQPQYTNRSSAGPKVIICPSTMSSFPLAHPVAVCSPYSPWRWFCFIPECFREKEKSEKREPEGRQWYANIKYQR